MIGLCGLVMLTGAWPLWRALAANRATTLRQPLLWAAGAWLAWALVLLLSDTRQFDPGVGRHVALALTGCAGVAVLGARRPGAGAWNFVVCGLLVTLMLPVAEGKGTARLDGPHLVFLTGTLAVGLANYLPTRGGPAALLVALGAGLGLAVQVSRGPGDGVELAGGLCLAAAPWAGLGLLGRPRQGRTEFDRAWLDFRDRYGFVWGQRVREQFNRAAANAGQPVVLRWDGLTAPDGADTTAALELLRAVLNRFAESEAASGGRQPSGGGNQPEG
jgi:hypothetical protein